MPNQMICKVEGNCQFEGCDRPATIIASGREGTRLGCYCEDHAVVIADDEFPEYHDTCPNCGCRFGVN